VGPLLELSGVGKRFGRVEALAGVDLDIRPAEAVGLIGDNGAGKSTLIKILSGVYPPSDGEMRLAGEPVSFGSPLDARGAGIEMIYQDLALCGDLDAAANVFLGREPMRRLGPFKVLDRRAMAEQAQRALSELGARLAPGQKVASMSGGERQLVAVARGLEFAPRLFLLDEPTAALSAEKIRVLLGLIEQLKRRGVAILLVSHRFTDIIHVCDRVVVLRQGRLAGELEPSAHPPERAMALMHTLMTGEQMPNGSGV
jgi:simple sugar transport system ATP-binding protein